MTKTSHAPTTEPRRGWSSARAARRRTRGWSFLFLVALLGGLFVSTPPQPTSADALSDAVARQRALEARIAKQRAQIAALTQSQATLRVKLSATRASLEAVNADLVDVKSQVVQMTVQVATAQAGVDELVATVAQLDQQLADVEAVEEAKTAALAARKAVLAEHIRLAYDTDRTSLLETFLSGNAFTDVLAEVSYQLDIGHQDKVLAEEIVADQKVLDVIHATVTATRAETDTMRAAAAADKADLDTQYADLASAQQRLAALEAQTATLLAEQQSTFAKIASDKAAVAAALAASEKAEEELAAKIAELVREQALQGGIPSEYSGTLAWPMIGTITQEFGCTGFAWEPPLGGCAHFHRGIDISDPMYTPILAAGPGRVVFAGANPYDPYPKAWIVIIAHSSHLLTWYGHVDNGAHRPVVKAGDWVVGGQVIAYEGMTGHTTGPHLHWAVQLDGTFTNPRLFL
jgi:murein DD-endopeptidase MepM/ murein hydrolase activator NlpD